MNDKGRISPVTLENAQPDVKAIYQAIQKKMAMLPNIFQMMGNSPAVIKAYMALGDAAASTHFSPQLREQVSLVVSEANHCHYCLSAHSMIAEHTGLLKDQIIDARKGHAKSPRDDAILKFCKLVIEKKGEVKETDVKQLLQAGISETELVELVLLITLNIFTNYFNNIIGTKVDFPEAPKLS